MSESRRSFTAEFKREAVQMLQKQGLSVAETARRPVSFGQRCSR